MSRSSHQEMAFYHPLRSLDEYRDFTVTHAAEITAQRAYETALAAGRSEFEVRGYCVACERPADLHVDRQAATGEQPNWRERLVCACGLNNRIRASLYFLQQAHPDREGTRIYATEQVTALFQKVAAVYPNAVGSEFLRDGTARGSRNEAGVRYEDLTDLTFADESFDVVLSFDVLEHVPDYRACLREMVRVLAPGGKLIASFPFNIQAPDTQIRAGVNADGSVSHYLPPEYHGDPLSSEGCLCFQVFGWDVLDELRSAGFSTAHLASYWSAEFGHLGANQNVFWAER